MATWQYSEGYRNLWIPWGYLPQRSADSKLTESQGWGLYWEIAWGLAFDPLMHDFLTTDLSLGWRFVEVKKAKTTKVSFGSVAIAFMLDEVSKEKDRHQRHRDKVWCWTGRDAFLWGPFNCVADSLSVNPVCQGFAATARMLDYSTRPATLRLFFRVCN